MTITPEDVAPPLDELERPNQVSRTWRYGRLPYGLVTPSIVVLLVVLAWPSTGSSP